MMRMNHLLISVSDGDSGQMKAWFSCYNRTLGATPCEMCKAYDGSERVADQIRKLKQSTCGRERTLAVVEFSHKEHVEKAGARLH